LVEKQRVCPVSGKTLGSMGEPHPVSVNDQTVFLCCPSCEESIRKDPDKYLGKLAKAT
jgi:YHS domain-containing protein